MKGEEGKIEKSTIKLGRKYSEWRIRAYECETDAAGSPIKKGKPISRGWYGLFNTSKLESEIMPKLAEYAAQGWAYPFLITQHRLESKATIDITPPKDLKYYPRKRQSEQTWVAIALGQKLYKILSTK